MLKFKKFIVLIFIIGVALIAANTSLAAVDTGIAQVDSSIALGAKTPLQIGTSIINFSLGFLAILAICLILWGGFVWMTSGGSEDKIAQAQKILRNGVIGLIIILSAWGIAYFVINKLLDVTGSNGNGTGGCTDNATISCGCGGAQTCSANSWGPCLNSTCLPDVGGNVACDGDSSLAECQADNNLCGTEYLCDGTDCLCKPKKGLGQSCDSNPDATCQADNNLCGPYLKCDPTSCLCDGPPVITGVSPVGGFCNNDENRACNTDTDCLSGGICNLTTPNGAANNFLTIYGYNFGVASKMFENILTNIDFEKGAVGTVPQDWTPASQQHSSVGIVSSEFKSGKQSVRLHQDPNLAYPGICNKVTCQDMGSCTWNAGDNTCHFVSNDDAHRSGPAVYKENESLVWGNSYNVMWAKLTYNLAPLAFKPGENYSIQFYYKGKTASNVSIAVASTLGWTGMCVGYDYYAALKPQYKWDGSKITPTPPAGEDPCAPGFGKTCADQPNVCCVNAPYQKKCYNSLNLTPIAVGNTSEWTLYSYTFQYTPEMDTWFDSTGKKMIEVGLSIGYNPTDTGTDLYVDDFTVTKILNTGQVTFLGANAGQSQLANFPSLLNPSCISSWTDRQVIIAVPSGAATGPIQIKREGNSIDNIDTTNNEFGPKINDFAKNNIKRPGLCLISPTRGLLGDKVVYQGINLRNGEAYFGNFSNPYKGINSSFVSSNLSGQTLAPSIMPGQVTTFVEGISEGVNQKSNALVFVKDQDPEMGPYISSFDPINGPAGQYITIRGRGFGNARGSRQVYFGDKEAVYDFPEVCTNSVWRDDQVVVKVPEGLSAGTYQIRINLGDSIITSDLLSPSVFKYDPTVALKTGLCKIDPTLGQVGAAVSLWGEYFGAVDTKASVVFNSDKSTSSLITKDGKADKVETIVPQNSISGPVYILKNGEWGNKLNFSVGKCAQDSECGSASPICCQGNTYKAGTCAASLLSCYFDVPNSVYEVSFNTGYNNASSTAFDSCIGMANYFKSCQTGQFCPNSPGKCSPYTPTVEVVGTCGTTSECGKIAICQADAKNCTYNKSKDVCQANSCQLNKELDYSLIDGDGKTTNFKGLLSCKEYKNKDGKTSLVKHLSVKTSCPIGWIKTPDGTCASSIPCEVCSPEFTCQDTGDGSDIGKCESAKLCVAAAYCGQNPGNLSQFACLSSEKKSCDCCCEIGKDTECCAPLKCAGTCGSDQSNDGVGYGSCSGCSTVGTTVADHDNACNCSTASGKFCQIDDKNKQGICVDCAALDQTGCSLHSDQCCYDASKKTCQGGNGNLLTGGFCAYYDCDSTDKTKCDINPAQSGQFLATSTCATSCATDPKTACDNAGSDPAECSKFDKCCFDDKQKTCLLGSEKIVNTNFCARYDCLKDDINSCKIPSTTGTYVGASACSTACNSTQPGASCASDKADACNTSICGNPYACLGSTGKPFTNGECGFCCCTPGTVNGVGLKCLPDKGNCSGASRGLFCGCKEDLECGVKETQGCGEDTCCRVRPNVDSTAPADGSDNICRNSQMVITFDQIMSTETLASNILLIEERDYNQGVCPAGTFSVGSNVASANSNFFVRLYQKISFSFKRVFNTSNDAVAAAPSDTKLYCVNPIVINSEQNFLANGATSTKTFIRPKKVMSPNANYFVVVKGDKDLNSNSGVMSESKVGLNAENSPIKDLVKGIVFNKTAFMRSYVYSFKTMDAKGANSGLCTVNSVVVSPSSFLIKTSENDPSDDNYDNVSTFDKAIDSDRLVRAYAYSSDKQLLQPVTGYFWDWNWQIVNSSVAERANVTGLPANLIVVKAKDKITDNSTEIKASILMDRFSAAGSCSASACSCADALCSAKCCNATLEGDKINSFAEMYVFLCANPWPMEKNGLWIPWLDVALDKDGKTVINHNYKFYYCRDAGDPGTADDLPAIADQALILGANASFICSDGGAACAAQGVACGNGGVCVWSVLKESYFFRETVPQTGEITSVVDTGVSGQVKIDWYSPSISIASYKIYYSSTQGNSGATILPVPLTNCAAKDGKNICSYLISGLTNSQKYNFQITSISDKKAESLLYGGKEATPSDKTAPTIPKDVKIDRTGNKIKVSWTANIDDTLKYRVYHGVTTGRYGESFDSVIKATYLDVDSSSYGAGDHFFAVTALDKSNNESGKSNEATVTICAPGTYILKNACLPCKIGFYSSGVNWATCEACNAGESSPAGSSKCFAS